MGLTPTEHTSLCWTHAGARTPDTARSPASTTLTVVARLDRNQLTHLRDYFSAALELTRREMQAGRSRDEITATETLPGFEDHVSPFPLLSLTGVLGVAYDELDAG